MEEIRPHPQGQDVHILLRYRQSGTPECIIPEQEHLQGSGFQIHTTKPCGNAPVQRLPVVFWTPSNRIHQHHPHHPSLRPLVCNVLLFNEFFSPNFLGNAKISLKCPGYFQFSEYSIHEFDSYDFTIFFGLDFLNFSGLLFFLL